MLYLITYFMFKDRCTLQIPFTKKTNAEKQETTDLGSQATWIHPSLHMEEQIQHT